jgi:thiamine pyrophosphate-dependent acetolactate synthase large subunit-like protein
MQRQVSKVSFGSQAMKLLKQYNVDTIFGIPGVHTIEYYRGITETGIKGIVPRHEQGAGFMADGYARISGKPGVCVLVSGPGVLNAATPIAQAWHDSIPMLVLAASTESELSGKNRGPLHDVPDQAGFFTQLTDASVTVTDPDQFAEVVAQAFASWKVNRARPVHISVPFDVLSKDVSEIKKVDVALPARHVSADDLAKVVAKVGSSKKIVLICGGGANYAHKEITVLAEKLHSPLITTGNARGLLPDGHPLNAGTTLPFSGGQALIAAADLVIAIGTEFSDVDIIYTGKRVPQPKAMIRVDLDATQLQSGLKADIGVVSDAANFAKELVAALNASGYASGYENAATDAATARGDIGWTNQSRSHFEWLDVISELMPANAIVSIDSTQLAYTAHHYTPWSTPKRWLAPYGLGTLGPAVPMGIGAKVAAPNDPVVIIAGDGGVLFTISELATARDVSGTIVTIIWDNAGYGEIRDSFDRAKADRNGVDISSFDLTVVAQGFGMNASRVRTPAELHTQFKKALSMKTPSVIVVTEPGSPADIK